MPGHEANHRKVLQGIYWDWGMQMNNIHEKSKRCEIPRYSAANLEFLEAAEDHRRNEESPEDHYSNEERADQHSMSVNDCCE